MFTPKSWDEAARARYDAFSVEIRRFFHGQDIPVKSGAEHFGGLDMTKDGIHFATRSKNAVKDAVMRYAEECRALSPLPQAAEPA